MDVLDNVKPPFECAVCSKGFSVKSQLNDHLYSHIKGESLINEICCKGFSEMSELNEYFRDCMIKNSCDACNAVFLAESDLEEHRSVHMNKTYVCKPHNKILENKMNLYAHTAADHKKSPSCDKQFVCQSCKESFECKSHLTKHICIYSKENPFYVCKQCNSIFDDLESLCAHTRKEHTKIFMCDFCGETFLLKKSLINHCWRCHKIYKPSPIRKKGKISSCEICKKQFQTCFYFKRHLRIHTEEKPYACDYCDKKFGYKISLDHHLDVHNRDKLIQASMSAVCNEQSSNENGSKNHCEIQKKANVFTCEFCGRQFKTVSVLKIHMGSHTKPYSCDHCEKRFSYKRSLDLHLVNHNKDKIIRLLNLPEGAFDKLFLLGHKKVD